MAVNKSTLYLDTSTINFLFADDAPEKKEITVDLFDNFIKPGIYNAIISEFVLTEIHQTGNEVKKQQLLKTVSEYYLDVVETSEEDIIQELADAYVQKGIIPGKKLMDALHVAFCVINKIDYLVSWNYKHLANINRERKILAVNFEMNYLHPLRIITPSELLDYEI
jgi:predicted nucleic acid-binding protein